MRISLLFEYLPSCFCAMFLIKHFSLCQCCIDLQKNSLVIGTNNTETKFLSESELPECARLNRKRTLPPEDGNNSNDLQQEEDRLLAEALAKSQKDALG